MKTLHGECIGRGRFIELEVIQGDDGTVRIQLDVDGSYGLVFRGTIEDARIEYKEMKAAIRADEKLRSGQRT